MAESSGSGDGSNSPGGKNGTGRGRVPSCEYLHGKLSALYGSLDRVPVGDTLDLVLFSHLIHHLSLADAIKAFLGLKGNFVDWNEVRISTAGDVQEMFRGGDGPLELAIFLKDFLNRL
ncbi:MAG: hypothetical protein ACE5GW_13865, partial [Planctomycetota bacterium]